MYYDNKKRIYKDKQDIERRCKIDIRKIDQMINNKEFIYFERRQLANLLLNNTVEFGAIEYSTLDKLKP